MKGFALCKMRLNNCALLFLQLLSLLLILTVPQRTTAQYSNEITRSYSENTNLVLQNGSMAVPIGFSLSFEKNYRSAQPDFVNFNVAVSSFYDSVCIDTACRIYTFTDEPDGNSFIDKYLRQYVESHEVSYETTGRPTIQAHNPSPDLPPSLATFISLNLSALKDDNSFPFRVKGLKVSSATMLNSTWTDNIKTVDGSEKAVYTFVEINDETLTVNYTKTIAAQTVNTNINGSLVIDKTSLLILENNYKAISVGYIKVDELHCYIDKRSAVLEVFTY